MSRLGRVWSKAEGSNRPDSNSNQNFTHGDVLPNDCCVPSLTATQFYTLLPRAAWVRVLRLAQGASNSCPARVVCYLSIYLLLL